MGREPFEYSVSGRILRIGPQEFYITITATAVNHFGPGNAFSETGKANTREEAGRKQTEMIRDLARRLRGQGHTVVVVDSDL